MVIITKLLYEMRFVVNNRQEPYGCSFPFFKACVLYIYISMRYIVMEKEDHGGGAMDLGAKPVA